MRVVGYCRVSTDLQAAEGVSLDAQKGRIHAWCLANGGSMAEADLFVDAGISGKHAANRPGLQHALDAVTQAPGSVLVVYSLSRLARSTKDTITISERLEKAGADLVSLSEKIDTTSASGKMVFRMLAVLAEFERDLVSERVRVTVAHKRGRGERVGQAAPEDRRRPRRRGGQAEERPPPVVAPVRRLNPRPPQDRRRVNPENPTMPTKTQQPRVTDQIRETIASRGLSGYAVAKAAGLNDSVPARFMAGARGLSSESVDAVAAALGLRVVAGTGGMRKRPKRARRRPGGAKGKAKPAAD
jgi:DNA invertase Pin-like site-specific DNA recombinase